MAREYLHLHPEWKFAPPDGDTRTGAFEGYGAVFGNVDSYGDVIKPGAFKDTLRDWKKRKSAPKMLLQHGGMFGPAEDGIPVGKWHDLVEDDVGLYVKGELFAIDTQKGRYIYEGMKSGALDGLSIGYVARDVVYGKTDDDPKRTLRKVDLVEVSIVTFPANTEARVAAIKSGIQSRRDFEGFLRDAGFSRSEAKRIASHGFDDSLWDAAEASGDEAELAALLRQQVSKLFRSK